MFHAILNLNAYSHENIGRSATELRCLPKLYKLLLQGLREGRHVLVNRSYKQMTKKIFLKKLCKNYLKLDLVSQKMIVLVNSSLQNHIVVFFLSKTIDF